MKRFVDWLERATEEYRSVQAFGLWFAAILTGAAAVAYAWAFKAVESTADLLIASDSRYLVCTPFLVVIAWWIVDHFGPAASGSGIPQVLAAIDVEYEGEKRRFVDRLLSIRVIAVKIASSLTCVAAGGAIGREGPTLQISASIFHLVGRIVRKSFPNTEERIWVIAGAAAGLASAFNTPLGGTVYAIEELGSRHFHRVRTALLTAVIISGIVAQSLIGSYLYLGYPRLDPLGVSQWPLVIAIGLVAGFAGGCFSRTLLHLSRLRRRVRTKLALAGIAFACGLLVAALIYWQRLSLGSGSTAMSGILFEGQSASLELTSARILGTTFAYLSGTAGGIFSPSLAIGACIGSLFSSLAEVGNANLFAMLGMIGFLTGVTQTPFTSFILVMEMSDRHSAVFPMMLTALIANSIARSVQSRSFYEAVKTDLVEAYERNEK